MFQYWGFGLHLSSEIEFPEFLPVSFDSPDVTIRLGNVPEKLEGDDVVHKVRVSMSPSKYLQRITGIASYYVEDGNKITIERSGDADEKSVRLFMLSNAMAAVLHQRNMIPLHASAVYHKDGLILFCGHSGAGKSTIATGLQAKGYRVFSDDVCVLRESKETPGKVEALPSYPMIKLWGDSFEKVGLEMADDELRLRPNLPKYAYYFHEGYETDAMPVKQVFVIDAQRAEQDVEFGKLGALESFNVLQRNTYRHVQMNGMKKRNFHFSIVSKLAAAVPVFRLSRPNHSDTVQEIISVIEANLD